MTFGATYNLGSVNCGKGVYFAATDYNKVQGGGGSFYNPATAGDADGFNMGSLWLEDYDLASPRVNLFADADCKGFYDSEIDWSYI